ncbi:hypothetical protein T439DRAFT_290110 [Meredithblackwellia eburnea MCA 4105]
MAELVLLVFLHGFKGGADTFDAFPERITHILSQTYPSNLFTFKHVLYPPYQTRGELVQAVQLHKDWLTNLVNQHRKDFQNINVVLLGHSMGGLVIADTMLSILRTAPSTSTQLAPNIIGLCAFDTPYWGLNPSVFKSTIEKAMGYAAVGQTVLASVGVGAGLWGSVFGGGAGPNASTVGAGRSRPGTPNEPPPSAAPPIQSSSKTLSTTTASSGSTTPKSSSTSWFRVAGAAAVLAAAGAGAAYYGKDAVSYSRSALEGHWDWAKSHLEFVWELWKIDELEKRLKDVESVSKEKGIGFRCFYTLLPKTPSSPVHGRTFIVLPTASTGLQEHFVPNLNSRAQDEIAAHVEMFTPESDGLYNLGRETCEIIGEWVERRGWKRNGSGGVKEGNLI